MSKHKKPTTQKQGEQVERKLTPEEERELIFSKAANFVDKQGFDETLDKTLAKAFLVEYKKHNPKFDHLLGSPKVYRKKYPDEYYRQMAHVLGLLVTDEKMQRKPSIMARITNDIIYDRFGEGFVREVQTRNPVSKDGDRPLYHHQLLTDDADQKLTQFIKDAISVMGECVGMGRFHLIQCLRKKFGKSWQMDAFMDNNPS